MHMDKMLNTGSKYHKQQNDMVWSGSCAALVHDGMLQVPFSMLSYSIAMYTASGAKVS